MKKKTTDLLFIIVILAIIAGGFSWKFLTKSKPITTNLMINREIVKKANALFADDKHIFLESGVTLNDVELISEELNRILVGRNLTETDLATTDLEEKALREVQVTTADARVKIKWQGELNDLFLSEEFNRKLAAKEKEEELKNKAEAIFGNAKENEATLGSNTTPSASDTSKNKAKDKTNSLITPEATELKAMDGREVNLDLVLKENVSTEKVTELETNIKKTYEDSDNPWRKNALKLIDGSRKQLDAIKLARDKVTSLFSGEAVRVDVTKEEYTEALLLVNAVLNESIRDELTDTLDEVATFLGEELEKKVYTFEDLSKVEGVEITSIQGNASWWTGPLTFIVTIKNNSNRNISFAFSRFVLQRPDKTLANSQYNRQSDDYRVTVKKGDSVSLEPFKFTYTNEIVAQNDKGSKLVYILDSTNKDMTQSLVWEISDATYEKKEATEPKKETSTVTVTSEEIADLRLALKDLGVDESKITDKQLEDWLLVGIKENLNQNQLLEKICKDLNLNYQELIDKRNAQESSS